MNYDVKIGDREVKIHNVVWRGKIVGAYDDYTKTYRSDRDYDKDQIYKLPKYKSAVGISRDLIKFLLRTFGEVKTFDWTILNFPNHDTFDAIIPFSEFIDKKTEVHHGKDKPDASNADIQYILSLYEGWAWKSKKQEHLNT